jgi:hypothetical protein
VVIEMSHQRILWVKPDDFANSVDWDHRVLLLIRKVNIWMRFFRVLIFQVYMSFQSEYRKLLDTIPTRGWV